MKRLALIVFLAVSCSAGEICHSIACKQAEYISKSLDRSVKPCDNFFRFVCGNYKLPAFDYEDPLIGIDVEDLLKDVPDFKPYQFASDLYKTCMDPKSLGQQDEDLLILYLNVFLKSLHFKEDNPTEASFDWIEFAGTAKELGFPTNYFIDFKPVPTYTDNSSLRFSIQMAPKYFDPFLDNNNKTQRELYPQYLSNITLLTGDGPAPEHLKNFYDFECKLADITVQESGYYTEDITMEELEKRWPTINWKRLVDKLLKPFADSDLVFTVWNEKALTQFAELMEKTPGLVYAHYAISKSLQYAIPFYPENVRAARRDFLKLLGSNEMSRKEICGEDVKKYAGHAIQHLYLLKHQKSVEVIREMTKAIKKEMIKMIEESKVLSKEEKKEGVRILEEMPLTIGYSENLTDSKKLEGFYEGAKVFKDNYLKTILGLNVFLMKKEYSDKIHKEFFKYPAKVIHELPNSWGSHLYVSVKMIPSDAFDVNRPSYLNYGGAGVYLAREMFKSVSHLGRKWQDGGEIPTKQLDCFRNWISKITAPFLKKSMKQSVERDFINYHIGFRAVYSAYKKSTKEKPEVVIPGVDFTPEQLFWMSFLQPICFGNTEPNQQRIYGDNEATMFEQMITGIFGNVEQISKDFKCGETDINPKHKCSWW